MKPIRLVSGFLTVGLWTLLSRILGFARDMMIAAFLGTGPVAEAFLIAFALPNMFRRFFAEGAFNMAFVPMFSKKLEAGEDAEGFARDAFAGLAAVLIVFSVIALLAMPWLVLAMASGFAGDERFDLAVGFGRIAFPYILFISLAALLSGVLNAAGRFTAAAAAPVLLNVLFITAMILATKAGWPVGDALAWTVPVAGLAQLALVWLAAKRAGSAPLVVMLTDGRANIARDGAPGRPGAERDALMASARFAQQRIPAMFVDTSARGEPVARRVAEAMRARYVLLPAANAKALGGLVRTAMQMAEGSDRV